jgi:DNA replication protein DnaC
MQQQIRDVLAEKTTPPTDFRLQRPTPFVFEKVYPFFVEKLRLILQERGVQLEMDQENEDILKQIALWYANDDRFSGNLKKGFLLHGGIGTGKTKIVDALGKMIAEVEQKHCKIIYSVDLYKLYFNQNDVEVQKLKDRFLTIIDDLGVEATEAKYFGNIIEPFNDLLDYRYRNNLLTIITTNLTPSEIKEKYGDRIHDRIKEMCNDLPFLGESRRK